MRTGALCLALPVWLVRCAARGVTGLAGVLGAAGTAAGVVVTVASGTYELLLQQAA